MNLVASNLSNSFLAGIGRFTRHADESVTDHLLQVMWSPPLSKKRVSYAEAEKLCAALDLGGHRDWSMPEFEQLVLLPDRSKFNPAIDADAFPDTKSDAFWSRTPLASSPVLAWVVDFSVGYAYCGRRGSFDAFVRAVRPLSPGQSLGLSGVVEPTENEDRFRLGVRLRDQVTGFVGIAIARVHYLTGCTQYGLVPPVKADGTVARHEYFDEARLVVVDEGVHQAEVTGQVNGGPNRDAPRA